MTLTLLLFPILRLRDIIKKPFVKTRETKVTFEHAGHPHLMKEVYTRKKENPDTSFYVEANPGQRNWHEYIQLGGVFLHNYYRLEVKEDHWTAVPGGGTFTASTVCRIDVDFSLAHKTVLTLQGDNTLTDSSFLQDWFRYCRKAGVEKIIIEK